MPRPRALARLAAAGVALAAATAAAETPARPPGFVDEARIRNADAEPGAWLAHGRTHGEQRYSPLDQIHTGNAAQLGLAWSYATGSTRGLEATPLVADGVLYATSTWSVVFALDAATGAELWRHDPQVPRYKGRDACCDVVNRGVALWQGRVYVGTLDGRLLALDARTGEPVWQVQTVDPKRPYTITGAPRVVGGRVIIGNGGAEFGVRGYVSAYDARTGALLWRFYTVPASVEGPHEHPELERAAETWSATSLFQSGLGGTVWDSIAYDPELDLLYVGVGNASVYNRNQRSPGGGDNLFLASILALRPDTGKLVWHYQTTPGDQWDYTATQHMILADLEWGGRVRPVLMQAPKNGFFYVLDRATGELLSAEPYVDVSWASRVDLETGRPVERPEASWSDRGQAGVTPGIGGGHNWHPMSYSPRTGLVYIPSLQLFYPFFAKPDYVYRPGHFNTSEDWNALATSLEGLEEAARFCSPSHITAWDPVAARRVWRVEHATAVPGGLLSTAGDLVFQGHGGGVFAAYHARTGARLWESPVGTGIMAPPISYAVDGVQYVAVLAGIGGSHGSHRIRFANANDGQVLAYKLGGQAPLPPVRARPEPRVDVPRVSLSPESVARGRALYSEHCLRCHGFGVRSSGLVPDLRHASRATHEQWQDIVLGGTRQAGGMASFADVLNAADARAIHAYVIARARHEPGFWERLAGWFGRHACVPARWLAD
ncbi:MAG: PQQ-dependent dehydrogenase, methanol/ethanol family [Proteobacteria bacterium]|nr:PQQ-dependent dehydrogenase, methanol/ethanol family [Pseudomonadota bacterium]